MTFSQPLALSGFPIYRTRSLSLPGSEGQNIPPIPRHTRLTGGSRKFSGSRLGDLLGGLTPSSSTPSSSELWARALENNRQDSDTAQRTGQQRSHDQHPHMHPKHLLSPGMRPQPIGPSTCPSIHPSTNLDLIHLPAEPLPTHPANLPSISSFIIYLFVRPSTPFLPTQPPIHSSSHSFIHSFPHPVTIPSSYPSIW